MKELSKEQALEIINKFLYPELYVEELIKGLTFLYSAVYKRIELYLNKDNSIEDIKKLYLENLDKLVEDMFIDVETGNMTIFNVLEGEAHHQEQQKQKTWKDELFDIIIKENFH